MIFINNAPHFKRSTLASVVALALCHSSYSMASQLPDDGTEMEAISVLGKAYRNTATKTALTPEETPQAINIIDGELLKERGAQSLNEALRYTPGVVTETKGGAVTMYDTFTIRGFSVSESYYDGLILQQLNGWNLQPQIDPIALQQVEVFKGPTSVLYGSMPPGGMVNMITKAPQIQSSTEIGVKIGTSDMKQVSLDSTGQIGDSNVSYRFIGLARQKDGQVDTTNEERYLLAPSITWDITEKTSLNVNVYYHNDPDMGMNSSIPSSGSVFSNVNGTTNASTFVGDENWSTFEREVLMLGYKFSHDFNDNWTFLQNARYTKADLYQENTYHYASYDETTGELDRYIYSTDESSEAYAIDNQLAGEITIAGLKHNILLGIDYRQLKGDSAYDYYGTTSQFGDFNIFNPDNKLIDSDALTSLAIYNDEISVKQLGGYFQDQVRLNKLVLIAGGRLDTYKSKSDYSGSVTEADETEFSYRVGALYEFDNGLSPFISYATSFEPVAGQSDFGEAFVAETGKQIEVGLKYNSADYSQSATASLFQIVKSNVVISDPDSADYQGQLQVGEVRSRGLELEGTWMINNNLDIAASYTYIDMEITKDSENGLEGTMPIYVPKHAANLWANYNFDNQFLQGTRLSAGVRYVGEMQMDATNTQGMVPDYTIADLSIGYDLGYVSSSLAGVQVNLTANNVFDTDSFACYDNENCWYGAERTVELGVNFKL
ncbi:TonB-dependent siderophore receptor [uncultured Psychromonas sp.]|uniref:TonB-dependent siderophore receptor n=1 Tax=uncultured Psychromonas sp. TaxID=173974 RepID=UPI0026119FEB|nr:TonB-dependent siderophore receptor [uncultured Psychromonas sp.]